MGRIVVSENISLDGVIQDPTGDEGFAFGGWFQRMSDEDRSAWSEVEFQEALDTQAWLIGRGTYTWFATRWADRPGEWADRLRVVPKYVVSSTMDEATEWSNSTVLRGDAHPDPPGRSQGQHGGPPSADTSRATAAGSVPTGTRTTRPAGRTTSSTGSATTRTAANAGADGTGRPRSRSARVRRQ